MALTPSVAPSTSGRSVGEAEAEGEGAPGGGDTYSTFSIAPATGQQADVFLCMNRGAQTLLPTQASAGRHGTSERCGSG